MLIPDYIRGLPIVVLNTLVIYLFLIAGFRLVGRRQLGQLTVVDMVIIIIMGSAVENAMIDGNVSLPAGLVSVTTLLFANRFLSWICRRNRRLRHFVTGGPLMLIHHGHVIEEHLRRAGLTATDVEEAIRQRGFSRIEGVRYAVLEEDGEINAIAMDVKYVKAKLKLPPTEGNAPA